MTRRAISAALVVMVLVLVGCGASGVASPPPLHSVASTTAPAPAPVAVSLPQPTTSTTPIPTTTSLPPSWPKGNAATTCEEWTGVMTEAQRYAMSQAVLAQIWRLNGLYFTPESARIQDFANDVGDTCSYELKLPKGTFGELTPATDTILAVMLQVQKSNWPKFLGPPSS